MFFLRSSLALKLKNHSHERCSRLRQLSDLYERRGSALQRVTIECHRLTACTPNNPSRPHARMAEYVPMIPRAAIGKKTPSTSLIFRSIALIPTLRHLMQYRMLLRWIPSDISRTPRQIRQKPMTGNQQSNEMLHRIRPRLSEKVYVVFLGDSRRSESPITGKSIGELIGQGDFVVKMGRW